MESAAILKYLTDTFEGLDVVTAPQTGDHFVFYDSRRDIPHDRRMPFVTLVHGDSYDAVSNLSRAGVYRVNIGVTKATYRALFGPLPPFRKDGGTVDTGHDFAVLDQLLPHPVYAAMNWVCILSPSEESVEQTVKPLLHEAYALAAGRQAKR